MKMHYVPQFLLRGFEDENGLWEFDTNTGNTERRNVSKAGQKRHFYSVELEMGLLQRIDGQAGAIFHEQLSGRRDRLALAESERRQLAHFLALFAIRTPQTFENFKGYVEEAAKNPQEAVDIMYAGRARVIEIAKSASPAAYATLVQEFGRVFAETWVLASFANLIREGKMNYLPDPKESFVAYINEERMNAYAARLLRFQWVWMWSEYGFVIGDNPLCRWSKHTGKWNYGLAQKDVEITIPVSQNLLLRMQRRQSHAKTILYCNRELTQKYNRRQVLSSVGKVYGPHYRLNALAEHLMRKYERRKDHNR
jgi:hypothetical protein